jgi:hypothetical protein
MKTVKINLFRLASHEFWRTMRAWRSDFEPRDLIERLTIQRGKALNESIRGFLLTLALTLWISNKQTGSDVSIDIFSLSVTVPVIYVSFATTFMNLSAIVCFLSYMHLNEFLRLAAIRYYKFENSSAMAVLFDGVSAWSLVTVLQFRFFESNLMHKLIILATLLAIAVPVLAVVIYIYLVMIDVSMAGLALEYNSPFGFGLSVISLLLLAYPIVLVVALFMPYKFTKNDRYTRWNFLSARLYRRLGVDHPQLKNWLGE